MNTLALKSEGEETAEAASDQALLRSWVLRGEGPDFAELVRRHLALVRGVARRMVGEDLAEDVAQMVFAILARKAGQLAGVRSLGAWLHQVTMLQCRNASRRRAREFRNQQAAMEHAVVTQARDPMEEALPHIDAAIASLPEKDRQLLFLRYNEGLTFAVAAERTGRSEAALRQQASRALEKLGTVLRRRGVVAQAVVLGSGLGALLGGQGRAAADVAARVASSAAAGGPAVSGAALFSVTLLTMSTIKCVITGACAALLVSSVPIAWRWHQIAEASHSQVGTAEAPGSVAKSPPADKPSPVAAKVGAAPQKSSRPPGPNANIMEQLDEMMGAEMEAAMGQWVREAAWAEARRMGRRLALTAEKEEALRTFMESIWKDRFADTDGGGAARKRQEERLAGWIKENLSETQFVQWQEGQRTRRESLTEKLAEEALHGFSSAVALNEDQKRRLFEAAAAKATAQLERGDYGGSANFGAALSTPGPRPLEELGKDVIEQALDEGQLELWTRSREQEELMKETLPRRFSDRVLDLARKVGVDKLAASFVAGAMGGGPSDAPDTETESATDGPQEDSKP